MLTFIKRHSLREPTLTPGFGSRVGEPAEQGSEMTLTFESGACADLDERQVALTQQKLGALDAALCQVLLRGEIRRQLEGAREMELAQPDRFGDAS